jgi:aspartate aminotransferase
VQQGHEAQFKITAQQLRRAVNEKTKAFIFNSPSNPTGAVYSQGEIEELADVIQETGIYVISDEIYEKIVYDGAKHFSIGSIKEIRDQVITVNGVSKAFAMTGWRLGYLGAAEMVAQAAAKVQSQITSNATSISQRAAEIGLKAPTGDVAMMAAEFMRRRDYAVSELSKIHDLKLAPPKGAFYLFPSLEHFVGKRVDGKIMKDDYDLADFFLEEEHLALVPGSPFGAKNYLRLSYACSMKELQQGIERFTSGCRKLEGAY